MKKLVFALTTLAAATTHAETLVSNNDVMFMASVTSDYRFRGISQSRLKPAIQGGIDYVNNPSGFYVGAWASTIKWVDDAGGDSKIELDVYGGKRGDITENITYDVGVLTYIYPSNTLGDVDGFESADTTEVYAQIGYGPGFIKYSNSVTNLFGFVDSKNSGYIDATVNIPVGGFTINLHAGHQKVENNSMADYDDWKVGATKDFDFASVALAVIGTTAEEDMYSSPANGKFLGKTALVGTITKMF